MLRRGGVVLFKGVNVIGDKGLLFIVLFLSL